MSTTDEAHMAKAMRADAARLVEIMETVCTRLTRSIHYAELTEIIGISRDCNLAATVLECHIPCAKCGCTACGCAG